MTYLTRITEQVEAYLEQFTCLDPIDSAKLVDIVDDEKPEGGVLVTVRFQLGQDFEHPKNFPGWLSTKLPLWARMNSTIKVEFEGDRQVRATFGYLPYLEAREFINLAHDVVALKGLPYEDNVIRIRFMGENLEVTRMSNRNPTTMVEDHGTGECIRHHGEHCYLNKHLLKLVLEA